MVRCLTNLFNSRSFSVPLNRDLYRTRCWNISTSMWLVECFGSCSQAQLNTYITNHQAWLTGEDNVFQPVKLVLNSSCFQAQLNTYITNHQTWLTGEDNVFHPVNLVLNSSSTVASRRAPDKVTAVVENSSSLHLATSEWWSWPRECTSWPYCKLNFEVNVLCEASYQCVLIIVVLARTKCVTTWLGVISEVKIYLFCEPKALL